MSTDDVDYAALPWTAQWMPVLLIIARAVGGVIVIFAIALAVRMMGPTLEPFAGKHTLFGLDVSFSATLAYSGLATAGWATQTSRNRHQKTEIERQRSRADRLEREAAEKGGDHDAGTG